MINPRTISTSRLDNLKRSLQEDPRFLDARPLLVNSYPGRENIVIASNMRLRAARELGWDDVPVLVVSLPPDIEAQWNLKDNNQWGDYVDQGLAEIRAWSADASWSARRRRRSLRSRSTPGKSPRRTRGHSPGTG